MQILLCKVILHAKRATQLETPQATLAKIISGDYGQLPNGDIIEPISSHATEEAANEARARAMHDDPSGDYRVVATFDEREVEDLQSKSAGRPAQRGRKLQSKSAGRPAQRGRK